MHRFASPCRILVDNGGPLLFRRASIGYQSPERNRRRLPAELRILNEPPTAWPPRRLSVLPRDHHALDGQRRLPPREQRELLFILRYRGDLFRDDHRGGGPAGRSGALRGGRGDVPLS